MHIYTYIKVSASTAMPAVCLLYACYMSAMPTNGVLPAPHLDQCLFNCPAVSGRGGLITNKLVGSYHTQEMAGYRKHTLLLLFLEGVREWQPQWPVLIEI